MDIARDVETEKPLRWQRVGSGLLLAALIVTAGLLLIHSIDAILVGHVSDLSVSHQSRGQ